MKTEIICYKIRYDKDCMKFYVACFFAEYNLCGLPYYRMKQISNFYNRRGNALRWAKKNNLTVA